MRVICVRGRQPSGLISIFRLWDESSSGRVGLMQGIKIPQQDFALKMQGGAYARGGHVFAGHYGIIDSGY